MLEMVLSPEYRYEEVDKSIFLQNLGRVFEEFRELGDTELHMLPGMCGDSKCPNFCTRGAAFEGNKSRLRLHLLIEKKGEEVSDISHCVNFRTFNTKEYFGQIPFGILDSEGWEKTRAAKLAMQEISDGGDRLWTVSDLQYWLAKYQTLKEDIEEGDGFATSFLSFEIQYGAIQSFMLVQEFAERIQEAMQLYRNYIRDKEDGAAILEWLLLYETEGRIIGRQPIFAAGPPEVRGGLVNFPLLPELWIEAPEWEDIAGFIEAFGIHYRDAWEAYGPKDPDPVRLMSSQHGFPRLSDFIRPADAVDPEELEE